MAPPPVLIRHKGGVDETAQRVQRKLLTHSVHNHDRLSHITGHDTPGSLPLARIMLWMLQGVEGRVAAAAPRRPMLLLADGA
jgi:hypothetical protein